MWARGSLRFVLGLLALAALASALVDDYARVMSIRSDWAIQSAWVGNCPGECNGNPYWAGLKWNATNNAVLDSLYVLNTTTINLTPSANSTASSTIHRCIS